MGIEQLLGKLFINITFEDAAMAAGLAGIIWSIYLLAFLIRLSNLPQLISKLAGKIFRKLNPVNHLSPDTKKRLQTHLPHLQLWQPVSNILNRFTNVLSAAIKPNRYLLAVLSLICLSYVAIFIVFFFFTRPYVVFQNPQAEHPWNNLDKPITIVFNKPVQPEDVALNISADITGDVYWQPTFSFMPTELQTYRAVEFYPNTTPVPEDEFVIYLVGMQSLTGVGGTHEWNLDFTGPAVPEVTVENLDNQAADVPTDQKLNLKFEPANTEIVEWNIIMDPETNYSINKLNKERWEVSFPEKLLQDTTYNVTVQRALIEKDLKTNKVLTRQESTNVVDLEFSTVKTPGAESISPSGKNVRADKPLVINFDNSIDSESFGDSLKIEPEISGSINWTDNSTLKFEPETEWEKDTKYTITVAEGIRTAQGGMLDKPIKHSFTTIGPVAVTRFSPSNGTNSASVETIPQVFFDQSVDRKSAESKFKISPNRGGSFKWNSESTELIFDPDGTLSYDTSYTITMQSGIKSKYGLPSDKSFSTTFSMQTETFSLGVPLYSQQERFTCNVAATRMALAYRGIYQSEATIKQGMGVGPTLNGSRGGDPYSQWIDGYGTYWTNAEDYINNYRSTAVRRNWNVPDMLKEVRNGNPVILWWQNGWSDWYRKDWTTPSGNQVSGLNGMHSEVVIGFRGPISNPHTIITRDPWRGTRYYSYGQFDNLWSSSFNRTGLVVY